MWRDQKGVYHRYVASRDEARALLLFLCMERRRHLHDVAQIERDIADLCRRWGVEPDPEWQTIDIFTHP